MIDAECKKGDHVHCLNLGKWEGLLGSGATWIPREIPATTWCDCQCRDTVEITSGDGKIYTAPKGVTAIDIGR